MSSKGEYYGVEKHGDKWVAMYDETQQLMGLSFDTEQEAWDFVEADSTPGESLEDSHEE